MTESTNTLSFVKARIPEPIDSLVNASRTDLLGNRPGGLFSVWDHVVPRQYRKRLYPGRSHTAAHQEFNYLRSTRVEPGGINEAGTISNLDETKFHRGFKRRLIPESSHLREAIAEATFKRYNARVAASIIAHQAQPRDVLSCIGFPKAMPYGRRACSANSVELDGGRKWLEKRRLAESVGRYHGAPLTRATSAPSFRFESLLVTNRRCQFNRVQSVGVYDNFKHTQLPMKIFPMKPSVRNLSQIVFY